MEEGEGHLFRPYTVRIKTQSPPKPERPLLASLFSGNAGVELE